MARRIATAAALLGAAAIVGILAWVTTRPSSEVTAELAHSNQYQPPHGLQPDTSFVRTRIGGSGVEQVTHWIHTGQAVRSVQLRIPQVPGLQAGDIYVIHVVVAGDGVRLPLTKTVLPGRPTTIAPPADAPSVPPLSPGRCRGLLRWVSRPGPEDASRPSTCRRRGR